MKNLLQCATILLLAFVTNAAFAQGNNCGNVEPQLFCPTDTTVCLMQSVPSPFVFVNSDLPDINYAIVDYTMPAPSGTGPSVIGIDIDGIFTPDDYGLAPGTSFGIIPVAFDLEAIRETVDDLLKGSFFLTPCCDLIGITNPGVSLCDTLTTYGVNCGSDVMGLYEATLIIGGVASGGDTLSIIDLAMEIDDVNVTLGMGTTPAACGGQDKVVYAYGPVCNFYIIPNTINLSAPHPTDELVVAADCIISTAIVNSPYIVEYNADICIELQAGFEVVVGADFTAETGTTCQ